ncbi:MAG: isochorismatase family protein [Photobacterium frigidiphilum]|uniref:isochorismatase family protein n=1 Tax=Photobacterium frigidiphilum TaxID=264736 RepID=UPI0030034A94
MSELYSLASIYTPYEPILNWRVKKENCTLLIHIINNYFVQALPDEPSVNMISSISKILCWTLHNKIPVFYSAQPGSMPVDQRGLLAALGAEVRMIKEERRIIDELLSNPDNVVTKKWRYSAFYQSNRAEMLRLRSCDSLSITGIYTPVDYFATAREPFCGDIHPLIVADGVADFSLFGHQKSMDYSYISTSDVVAYE